MKALVLHGYGQDAKLAEEKWSKTFKKAGLDVTYLEAPIPVINKYNELRKGWFMWTPQDELIYISSQYHQVNDSLEYIFNFINTNEPFDVIIGYSQGGTIASILLSKYKIKIKYLIIISSYESLDPTYKIDNNGAPAVLLVYGEKDITVPKEYTLNMYKGNDRCVIYGHKGTHSMPSNQEFVLKIKKFVGLE